MKKIQYLLLGVLVGIIISGSAALAAGYQRQITVDFLPLKFFINGTEKSPAHDRPAFMYNGSTYVPVRFIADSLGQPVEWDGNTMSIYIGEKGGTQKITVGSDTEYPPFEYKDSATGKYTGFDIDLLSALAREAKLDIEIKSIPFDKLISALQEHEIDAIASGMTITEGRKSVLNFSDPYFQSGLVIAVRQDNSDINSLQDIKSRKVGAVRGTTSSEYANKASTNVIEYISNEESFLALKDGKVDAVICDYASTANYISKGNNIKIAGPKILTEYLGLGVSKENPELLAKLNSALKALKESGEYEKIYSKWFKDSPEQ